MLVRRSGGDPQTEEGLRVAVGLTLGPARLTVVLADGAVELLDPATVLREGGVRRHWSTLGELGVTRAVERESLRDRGFDPAHLGSGITLLSREQISQLLARADFVLVF